MASFLGFVQLFVFFATWLGSAAFPGLVLAIWWFSGNLVGLIVLVGYYSFRAVFPRGRWAWLHRKQIDMAKRNPYFRRQDTVFEKKVPADSKSLLCVHPHGILCCGWSLNLNMDADIYESGVTFLGTDVLFKLPFISDMLSWYGCGPASKENMLSLMKNSRYFEYR